MSHILNSIEYHRNLLIRSVPGTARYFEAAKNAAAFTRIWREANTLRAVE